MRALADRDRLQPFIAPDAVVHVDDEIARGEGGQFGEEGVRALAALLAADEPVAEDVLLGDDFQVGIGKAALERQDQRDRCAVGRGQGLLPAFGQNGFQLARVAQNRGDARPAACGIGCDDRLAARFRDAFEVGRRRLVDIFAPRAFGRKIAGAGHGEIDDRAAFWLGENVGAVDRPAG